MKLTAVFWIGIARNADKFSKGGQKIVAFSTTSISKFSVRFSPFYSASTT